MEAKSTGETDIIIKIAEHLRLNSKDGEIVISPAELDEQLKLPKGSVEKHLVQAADKVHMKIFERGPTQVRLRKVKRKTPWVSALWLVHCFD